MYVCLQSTDLVKRQGYGRSTITVPRNELRDVLLRIRWLEIQVADMLREDETEARN